MCSVGGRPGPGLRNTVLDHCAVFDVDFLCYKFAYAVYCTCSLINFPFKTFLCTLWF